MSIKLNRALYSYSLKAVALHLIPECRRQFKLETNMMAGTRFNDDENVFERLESHIDTKTFSHFPLESIARSLTDAAQADYWYEYEKDYGYEDAELEIETEIDEACE